MMPKLYDIGSINQDLIKHLAKQLAKAGIIKRETKRATVKTIVTVIGIKERNFPTIPGKKKSGKNTINVVSIPENNGDANSLKDFHDASFGSNPFFT